MYSKPFYITSPVGNNSFGQPARIGRNLYVPELMRGSVNDLKIGKEIAFEELDEKGKIISFRGLENFIEASYNAVPLYIFDNHNHAFYFWNLSKLNGVIQNGATLIHIDEHSDMREPEKFLNAEDLNDISKIFEYTNFTLNVGNYIIPAMKSGLIGNIYNIQSESELDSLSSKISGLKGDVILNLDLDFFSDEMEYIDYEKKKRIILDIAQKSKLITISSSPFFIDGTKAIEICKDIFR